MSAPHTPHTDLPMLKQHTLDQLHGLRLDGMVAALTDTSTQHAGAALPYEQRLAMLAQRELDWRDARRVAQLLKAARLKVSSAWVEGIDWRASQGLYRHLATALAGGDWVRHGRNVLITGATDCGETWLACALAQQAARQSFGVVYTRATRLLQDLQVAHGDGSFSRRLAQLAWLGVLVLDDLAIAPITAPERQDLLELLDDRVGSRSTLITCQLPTSAWHAWLAEPTIADAIMDRLLHGARTPWHSRGIPCGVTSRSPDGISGPPSPPRLRTALPTAAAVSRERRRRRGQGSTAQGCGMKSAFGTGLASSVPS